MSNAKLVFAGRGAFVFLNVFAVLAAIYEKRGVAVNGKTVVQKNAYVLFSLDSVTLSCVRTVLVKDQDAETMVSF